LTKNPELKEVSSIVDYVFRWLGMKCSDDYRAEQAARTGSANEPNDEE
jgi:hypothetical protein